MKKADSSGGRYPPESGRVSLETARRGESNGIVLALSAWLERSAGRNRQISHWALADVRQSLAGPHCNPLESGRASLQSARVRKGLTGIRSLRSNKSVNLDGRACPSAKVDNIQ